MKNLHSFTTLLALKTSQFYYWGKMKGYFEGGNLKDTVRSYPVGFSGIPLEICHLTQLVASRSFPVLPRPAPTRRLAIGRAPHHRPHSIQHHLRPPYPPNRRRPPNSGRVNAIA